MARILLIGCGGNASMNFIKSVKKNSGHTFYGMDMNRFYLDASSVDVKLELNLDHKLECITQAILDHHIDMVHAQPDPELKFLLENKAKLIDYVFPHSLDIWEKFSNKLYCQKIWGEKIIGIKTYSFLECCLNPKYFEEMKHAGKGKVWLRAVQGAGSKAALPVTNFNQAEHWVSYWEEARGMNSSDFMLCEHLPGNEYAVQTFWLNGQLIQSQARQRLIYFFGALMPSGQTSTPAVACTVDDQDVYLTAYRAITAVDPLPHGIYCVDLKRNSSNTPVPMEVNYGRFFTTSDFFAELGVNSPLEYVNSFVKDNYKPTYKVESIKETVHWIRGLDREPKLMQYE